MEEISVSNKGKKGFCFVDVVARSHCPSTTTAFWAVQLQQCEPEGLNIATAGCWHVQQLQGFAEVSTYCQCPACASCLPDKLSKKGCDSKACSCCAPRFVKPF